MTPVDSPHVLLTRAADLLEQLAAAADMSYLNLLTMTFTSTQSSAGTRTNTSYSERPAGEWATVVSPAVAPHLVAWLRYTARRAEIFRWDVATAEFAATLSSEFSPALAFARTVLGMEAETP